MHGRLYRQLPSHFKAHFTPVGADKYKPNPKTHPIYGILKPAFRLWGTERKYEQEHPNHEKFWKDSRSSITCWICSAENRNLSVGRTSCARNHGWNMLWQKRVSTNKLHTKIAIPETILFTKPNLPTPVLQKLTNAWSGFSGIKLIIDAISNSVKFISVNRLK